MNQFDQMFKNILLLIDKVIKMKTMTNLYNTYNYNLAIAQDYECVKGCISCIVKEIDF